MVDTGLEIVKIEKFTKIYDGGTVAVKDLDLSIDKGDIYGFIGPNGAGKTTTIKFLSTLIKPSFGTAWIDGKSVTRDPIGVKRSIGYMPDFYGVYNGMTVTEFLDFFASAYGISVKIRRSSIDDLLELLDLTEKKYSRVDDLSRGMKQRLCLARTMIHNPPVLILDEPASGLDPRARVDMKRILKELQKLGKTIIISSHILSELADLCNKVMIIERGSLVVAGPIEEISRNLRKNTVIRITVHEDPSRAAKILDANPHVRSVEVYDGQIRIEFSGTTMEVASLHENLVSGGAGLIWFTEDHLDLEEVFLSYTTGEVA